MITGAFYTIAAIEAKGAMVLPIRSDGGISLSMADSNLDLARAKLALSTCAFGHTIQYHPSVGSTMPLARDACQSTIPSGRVILTDQQTQGRGRLNRSWETPFGKALLLSVILGAELLPERITDLPVLAAVAVRQAIIKTAPALTEQIMLKWPNDVLGGVDIRNGGSVQKVAGILTETAFTGSDIDYAILGIGINVNQAQGELLQNASSGTPPTSLQMLAGQPLDRTDLLIALCRALNGLRKLPKVDLWQEWRSQLHTLGQMVTVTEITLERQDSRHDMINAPAVTASLAGSFTGRAIEVTPEGQLVVENAQGERRAFSSGEVTLRSGLNMQDDV